MILFDKKGTRYSKISMEQISTTCMGFHSKNISLDRTGINKDGNFDVLDLGAVLKTTSKKDRY